MFGDEKIKTVRDLRNLLETITNDAVLDSEIRYCIEEDGMGTTCANAWFDFQAWDFSHIYPTITICVTEEDFLTHEGRTPWNDWEM